MTIDTEHKGSGSEPFDSSTVVLLRDGPSGLEVFLMRRHKKQSFMGGASVFPGGALDDADMDAGLADSDACASPGERLGSIGCSSDQKAMGLFVCAVRELFEEAGRDRHAGVLWITSGRESIRCAVVDEVDLGLGQIGRKTELAHDVEQLRLLRVGDLPSTRHA